METFSYLPDLQAKATRRPNVKQITFGEGYESRISFGMNTTPEVWALSFLNRDQAEGDAIDAFLSARGAVEAFYWTPPGGTEKIFVCRTWDKQIVNGSYRSVSCTFEQVFEVAL